MEHKIIVPAVGESITEVRVLSWLKKDGEAVGSGDVLAELETDKASVEVVAEHAGRLTVQAEEGATVKIGASLGVIDTEATGSASKEGSGSTTKTSAAPSTSGNGVSAGSGGAKSGPAAHKLAAERGQDISQMQGTGKDGRVTKADLLASPFGSQSASSTSGAVPATRRSAAAEPFAESSRELLEGERRVPMSALRQKIAERLVQAQQTAAILSTFNEVDLSEVMAVRKKHKDAFKEKHGVSLGFMSFFTRASALALKDFEAVNASIEGTDIIYKKHVDMGIAVGTDRGLVVPVLRQAESLSFADIEKGITALAEKAKNRKLSIAEMSGGSFTISNGGVYGSLLSTPILNPPQSGILGMHKIQERPVAMDGEIKIRPMMYLALSYDHRIIDGKEAVGFLVKLKELLEKPEDLGLDFL